MIKHRYLYLLTFCSLSLLPQAVARHNFEANNILTAHGNIGDFGGNFAAGLGIEYEYFVTPGKIISLTLPFDFYYGGTIEMGEFEPGDNSRTRISGFYFSPGVRVHPIGNKHRADLGIGASFLVGQDTRQDQDWPYRNMYPTTTHADEMLAGSQLQVSLNLQHHSGFTAGFFLNAAYLFSHAKAVNSSYHRFDNDELVSFGIRLGGRW